MKVTYQTKNGKLKVELEGDSQRDIFGEISKFQEVFEEDACGKCGSDNIDLLLGPWTRTCITSCVVQTVVRDYHLDL